MIASAIIETMFTAALPPYHQPNRHAIGTGCRAATASVRSQTSSSHRLWS